jgi:hypothetical protein
MKKYWTFNKYQIVKSSQVNNYLNKKEYAILTLLNVETDVYKRNYVHSFSTEEIIITKNVKKMKNIMPKDILLSCYIDDGLMQVSQEAEMIREIQSMNSFCEFAINAKDDSQLNARTQIKNYPTTDLSIVKSKILLIAPEDCKSKEEDIKKVYSGNFSLTTKEIIATAILEDKTGVTYLAHTSTNYHNDFLSIHDPASGKIVYLVVKGVNQKLDNSDFKAIVKGNK